MKRITESILSVLSLGVTGTSRTHTGPEKTGTPRHSTIVAAYLILALCRAFGQDITIIANSNVSSSDLRRIFLEDTDSLRDGTHVEPVLQKNNPIHAAFCEQYLRRRASEARSYYLALAFTGKGSIPKEFNSDSDVVEYVAKTRGAIGYVSSSAPVPGVKTIVIKAESSGRERVLLTRIEPEYPEVLRKLKVGGTVRLRLVISPKGVESAALLGGNPILAEAAVAAAKPWVYAPAGSQSTVDVSIPFEVKP